MTANLIINATYFYYLSSIHTICVMKRLILISLFVATTLSSCLNDDNRNNFKIGLESEFQYGIINRSDNNSLIFSITEINDSRCPSDVVCIWQGEAVIKIEIDSPQKGTIN